MTVQTGARQADHVENARTEHDEVDENIERDRDQHVRPGERWRHGVARAHQAVDDPGLPSHLGDGPSGDYGDKARRQHREAGVVVRARRVQPIAPSQPQPPIRGHEHQNADADHDAESEEDRCDRRALLRRRFLQALDHGIGRVTEVIAGERGNRDLCEIPLGLFIGNREQHGRRMRLRIPESFHRRELHRLMMQRVHAMQIAGDDLDRYEDRDEDDRHAQHGSRFGHMTSVLQMPCADTEHGERRRQEEARHRVRETIGKRRIEDHRQPVRRHVASVDDIVADRGLHPAIGSENPERREQRAGGDHHGGKEMRPRRHALAAEEQDAEEARLEKEGDETFVREQRPEYVAGRVGIAAPVGSELERHHDA